MFEQLLKCNLFRNVTLEQLTEIKEKIYYQVKSFEKDAVIVSAGEKCNNLLIVVEGIVRAEMIDLNGKTIKIEDIVACRPLAPAFLFGSRNQYPVTIIANNDVTILSFPSEMIIHLFQLNQNVMTNFLDNISNRAQFLSDKIKFLSFQNIKGKIASYILEIAGDKLKSIELKKNQQELADLFGITRPSLARALGEMNKEGCLRSEGKIITIENKEMLLKYIK